VSAPTAAPTTESINAGPDDIGWMQLLPNGRANIYVIRPGLPTFVLLNLQVKPCPFGVPTDPDSAKPVEGERA
jgi:hypothetical protein